jgi:TrpR-related protein YerC/YecD
MISPNHMHKTWKTLELKKLARAFLSLKTEEEMLGFLRDLCTPDELEEFAVRWEIAQMLAKGESYREVANKTKVSTTTVTRVALWLEHGEGGYKAALAKIKKYNIHG